MQRRPAEPFEQLSTFMIGVASSDASLLNVLKGERAGHLPNPFTNAYNNYMRFCIAREDEVLRSALRKLQDAMAGRTDI